MADSIGSIVGGVLFSFVLVRWLDHFAMLYLPALLNLAMAGFLARQSARRELLLTGIARPGLGTVGVDVAD